MAASGVVLGIGFDVIEVITHKFRLRSWTSALMDIGYWLVATLFVFQVLVYANEGQVRMFVFIGLFVGVLTHFLLLSRHVRIILTWMLTFCIKFLRVVIQIVHILVIKPILYVYRRTQIVVSFLLAVAIFIGRFILRCYRYLYRLI